MRREIICVAVLVAGCASPYQSDGLMGGYTETALAPDVVRISFRGNAYTSPEQTFDFALLRAAEYGLERDYGYFVILDEAESEKVVQWTSPGTARTSGSGAIEGRFYGPRFAGDLSYSSTTTYTPPRTTTMVKPRTALTVRYLQDKPEGGEAFDAAFLVDSLRTKYKIIRP